MPKRPDYGLGRAVHEFVWGRAPAHGDRKIRPVPPQLEGIFEAEPEPAPTAASMQAALDQAARNVQFDRERLLAYCREQETIRAAAFYGSILREDFFDCSDVDILLDGNWGSVYSHIKPFEAIFGRPVDFYTLDELHRNPNPLGVAMIWISKRTFFQRDP